MASNDANYYNVLEVDESAGGVGSNRKFSAEIKQSLEWEFAGRLDALGAEIIDLVLEQSNYEYGLSRKNLADMLHIHQEPPPSKPSPNLQTHQTHDTQEILKLSPVAFAQKGYKALILLRGLPGSGKSTCARQMLQAILGTVNPHDYIFSADDFFMRCGEYRYNRYEVRSAHEWCQKQAHNSMVHGKSPVLIDNTNTEQWEMLCYVEWAVQYGYKVFIIEPNTLWKFKPGQLARKNKHDVPKEKIMEMLDRYDRHITVERIFKENNLFYTLQPPLMRSFPPIAQQLMKNNISNVFNPKAKVLTRDAKTSTKDDGFINELMCSGDFINNGLYPPVYPRDGYFDKGTWTGDDNITEDAAELMEFSDSEGKDEAMKTLSDMFELIPREHLEYAWYQCGGDLQSCIDLLVEDNSVDNGFLEHYQPPKPAKKPKKTSEAVETTSTSHQVQQQAHPVDIPSESDRKVMEDKKLALKKHLETNVMINPEYYKPVRPIKQHASSSTQPGPSNAHNDNKDIEEDGFVVFNGMDDREDSISVDSEGRDTSDGQEDDMVELNLGPGLVDQLNTLFGSPEIAVPSNFYSPTVEVPRQLANQLHALYFESLLKQMEAQQVMLQHMLEEDEELQMKLQLEEIGKLEEHPAPSLKQIMKDQAEAQRQRKLAESQWRNLTPEDMAYKMTMQKLSASFPRIASDVLTELYNAHDCCFDDTVESLRSSGAEYVENAKKTISVGTLQEMQTAHDASKIAETRDRAQRQLSSTELRQEAQNHQKQRVDLLNKAKQYYHKGMSEVATFYSELASQQTRMCEKYNSLAAVQIVNEGFHRSNKSDTLDLHYLRVAEALNTLDIYIDETIDRLLNKKCKLKDIYVITGRGNNSPNGIPRIRPSVIQRLKKRNLKFTKVNDGLLKVKIFKNSLVTANLPKN